MSGLSSLRGIPPPGARRSVPDSGGEPLSSLADAPSLSGNKPKPTFHDDDDDFSGLGPPTFSKPGRARSSPSVKSSVRKSTPNPQTARFDDDDDYPKVTAKKGVHFAKSTSEKRGIKGPFGDDDDDDFPKARKSSTFKNPFSDDDDKPSGRLGGGVSASTSSAVKPSASNPAFKWDDDSPPRGSSGLAKSGTAGKSLWDDDDDPILKKLDDPFSRPTASGVRSSVSKPIGKSPDDIFGMMKDDPPPVSADLGLDLFGSTASKPAAGPRAGRRAAGSVQQSMTDLSPEISREPTPEPARPAMSPEPSSTARPGFEASGGLERSRSTPRGSSIGDEFGEAPARSAASAIGGPRARGNETGPSVTTLMGAEASSTSPPSRVTRPSGGVGGGMELDVDDLPGIGSPAILSKNPSTASVQGAATAAAAAPAAGRRVSPAAAAAKSPLKNDDSWEMDDNLLPDESNNPPPKSPPMAAASSGYTPSAAEAPGKSRLQHTTFGGQKKEDEPQDDDESAAGSSYMPSFGRRQSAGSGLFGGGLGVNPTAASVDSSGMMGSALNPGGPGAPRPRRQMGASTDATPTGSLTGSGFGSAAAAKPGAPPVKKTKDEEERERVAKAMAEAAARRQQRLAAGPIRLPGQDPPAPTAPLSPVGGAASNRGTDSGLVPTPTSPSPVRPGAGGKPGIGGFGKKTPGLGFSSDSSDDDVPQPDKAISPPLPTMTARKAAAGAAGHQPTRATTTGPLARDAAAFDSRVASSVPEMGAAAAAAALGTVPGPGPGSIMQSSAPAPPLLQEPSYPHSVGSQPSGPSIGPVPSQTALPERSGTSSASQPSAVGSYTVTGASPLPGVTALSPQPSQMQGGVSQAAMQQPAGLPPGVTSMAPQAAMQQPAGLPPGVTSMAPQAAMQQPAGLPPGVTSMAPQAAMQQPAGLPPGVTSMAPQAAMQQPASLPPGVTSMAPQAAMQQPAGLPPGVTSMAPQAAMQQPAGLPPGVTSMAPQAAMQQPAGLPPGVTSMAPQAAMQQPAGLPPGVTSMAPQAAMQQPGMVSMQQQQQQQQRGLPPGITDLQHQHQQMLPPGVTVLQQPANLPPGVTQMLNPQQGQPRSPGGGLQKMVPVEVTSPGALQGQRQASMHHLQHGGMSTAFAVPPDSGTAVAVTRVMPPQSPQPPSPHQQQFSHPHPHPSPPGHHVAPSLAIPGSEGHSPGEPTLGTARLSLEPIKDALVKSLQDELEKVSKQVSEVKATYDKQLAEVRSEYERQLADTRGTHQKQLLDVRALAERQVEEARAHHRKQMEDMHAHHERQLDEVRRRLERQTEESRVVQERVLVEARAQRDKVLEDARLAQTKALEDARGQQQRALEDTRALHERVLADTQAVHIKQVVELKNLYESELRRAAHDVGRAVDDTRRVAEEARRQEAEARRSKEEAGMLRDRILGLEAELRARDAVIRESESRLVQLDTRNKTELAETQANAIKEAALMKLEMEDAKAALGRVRQQYEEAAMAHAQEIARYRGELDAQRIMADEELQRARLAAAEQIAAAEARGRRAGMLDKEIAEATIRQQMAAIAEEKEVVARHRLSAELLAQLTEKVRAVAVSSLEREERALSALERDVADREGRLAAREKLLGEREGRVALRERDVDMLRADLQNLMVTLETSAVHDREDLKREQLRLTREAARIEAATSSLQAEREDLRMQIAMEKRLLEEGREARRREREELLTEVTAERRRLATEYADTQRQLDAARTELLAVRSRLVDLESRCSGAAAQAVEEEKRLEALRLEAAQTRKALETEAAQTRNALEAEAAQTRQALQAEVIQTRESLQAEVVQARDTVFTEVKQTRESLQAEVARRREELQAEASEAREVLEESKEAVMLKKASVDIEARELLEYAAKLRTQSDELAARAAEAEARNNQIHAAMEALTRNQAEMQTAQDQLEEQRVALEALKKTLDKDRMALKEERRALAEERLAASRSADVARTEQLRLTESVRAYVQQGIPIPFAMDGSTGHLKPVPPSAPPMHRGTASSPDRHRSSRRRGPRPPGRSRNALKHLLDRLGMDAAMAAMDSPGRGLDVIGAVGGGGGASSYVRAQNEFLEKMRQSAPAAGPTSVAPKLNSPIRGAGRGVNTTTTVTSPIPAGLNPALLPPSLAAVHARSAAATPVKHISALPLSGAAPTTAAVIAAAGTASALQLESDLPAATRLPSFSAGLAGSPPFAAAASIDHEAGIGAASPYFPRSGSAAAAAGLDESSAGGGTAVIQQLLDTIQMALKKSSRVSVSKASDLSTLEAVERALQATGFANAANTATGSPAAQLERRGTANVRNLNPQRRQGGGSYPGPRGGDMSTRDVAVSHVGGGSGTTVPRLNLVKADGISMGLESEVPYSPLRDVLQTEAQVSSIASLEPLSASNASLDDVLIPRMETDSPDLSGPLGRGLDQLAEQLSGSTIFDTDAITPANTLMSRTVVGTSLGSEDTFGLMSRGRVSAVAARQQQLGELAAMSEMLAARLEALGLGQSTGSAVGGRLEPGDVADSQASGSVRTGGVDAASLMSSVNFSPRVNAPVGAGGFVAAAAAAAAAASAAAASGGGAAVSRQTSLRLSPSMAAAPGSRALMWAGAAEGLARSLTGTRTGGGGGGGGGGVTAAVPGAGVGLMGMGGGLSSTTRSAADTPLLGSANAEALAGLTLPQQQSSVITVGQSALEDDGQEQDDNGAAELEAADPHAGDEGALSTIASVDTISDDDDGGASLLP
ncbi:hypothetical protein Vafri_6355 [Volvox africanus]|uniref:Uncharacterized protein n=1 Tax=Volvox africanus TaxID=51714 RepID=A0A8J4AYV0_9CHLO|nr:hypothetical protein Vafri_6355 [Volvox africanus]